MNNNRSVIITGAGAVRPWGAPSTKELTDLLRNDKVFIHNEYQSIGEYLYNTLSRKENEREPRFNESNFETILYLIEVVYEYRKSKSQMPDSFFRINDIFNLKEDIDQQLQSFQNTNPNIYSGHFLNTAFGEKRMIANDYYYFELFLHFISLIKEKVEKYEKAALENYSDLNCRFNSFLDSLKQNKGIIRFYSLNYDYLPIMISNIPFFNGYDKDSNKINVNRIVNDDKVDCYYNLHGSFRLNFKGEISNNYDSYYPQKSFSNNGLIPTNIISGYNKLDRILGEPYLHFYNKLVEDCYKASYIFIIGYSFGDLHINAAINGAMLSGKAKLICIDCCEIDSFVLNYNRTHPTSEYRLYKETPGDYKLTYTKETQKVKLHLDGLDEFLNPKKQNVER